MGKNRTIGFFPVTLLFFAPKFFKYSYFYNNIILKLCNSFSDIPAKRLTFDSSIFAASRLIRHIFASNGRREIKKKRVDL